MKILIGTDEERAVIDEIAAHLRERGHDVTVLPSGVWGPMATTVGRRVARGDYAMGVVCCWTGTGAAMAAGKVDGVRAALCVDAVTAAGARKWNDANVLALSLRLLSEPVAKEILDAWLDTPYGGTEDESLDAIRDAEVMAPRAR